MLKVHTQKLGEVTILRLQGGIVTGQTTTLRNALLSESEVSAVVLDLARVSRVDAGGLGVLLDLRQQLGSRGIEFRLMNVTKLVQQVLEITRLNSVFELTSEAEVLSAKSRGQRVEVVETASCAQEA